MGSPTLARVRRDGPLAIVWWLLAGCISPHLPESGSDVSSNTLLGCFDEDGRPTSDCPTRRFCDPLAAGPEQVRIVTWNIKAGANGLDGIVDLLREQRPDVALLQEVDYNTERSGHVDQPKLLAKGLGDDYQYVFAPTVLLEGGLYGIAALSRLPLRSVGTLPLSNELNAEHRTAIDMQLCVGRHQLRVVNHHADYTKPGAAQSCRELAAELTPDSRERIVLGGDFNQLPTEPGPAAYSQANFHDAVGPLDSSPTFDTSRIDYIFVNDRLANGVLTGDVVQTQASDHHAVRIDLSLRETR